MPLGSDSSSNDFIIFAMIGDRVFSQSEFISFTLSIAINKAPTGELVLLVRNGIGLSPSDAGNLLLLELNNVSDEKIEKSSSLMCIIDSVEEKESNAENNVYSVKFTAGTPEMLSKKTAAYTGTSTSALEDIYAKFEVANSNSMKLVPLNSSIKFADSMTWRCASDNFWEQMNVVTSRSYRENDYLFWLWDDVNDSITISTLQNASGLPDRYVFLQSDDSLGATDVVKRISENPDYTVWKISEFKRGNNIGQSKEKLFPNTSLGATSSTKQVTGEIRGTCFSSAMNSMGNTSGKDIEEKTALAKGSNYAELKVVRQNPNNTHNMYAVADTVRDYVMATYAKRVKTIMFNNPGPPVGSKVLFICVNNNAKTGTTEVVDPLYSDSYIVTAKHITYTSVGVDKIGRIAPETAKQRTVIELISNNFESNGLEKIEKAAKHFKWM